MPVTKGKERSDPDTMRAAAIDRPGGPSVLKIRTMPVPRPGESEILIAVESAGIGSWDADMREGWSPSGRPKYPLVLGTDGAGTVAEVGSRVRRFRPGDRVYGYSFDNSKGGFYAEYVVVEAGNAAPAPGNLDASEAGAMPATGLTAIQGVDDALSLRKGETVLVHGASGGVGSLAVQFAKWRGTRVLASASGSKGAALAKRIGADAVVDGKRGDLAAAARMFAPRARRDPRLRGRRVPLVGPRRPPARGAGRVAQRRRAGAAQTPRREDDGLRRRARAERVRAAEPSHRGFAPEGAHRPRVLPRRRRRRPPAPRPGRRSRKNRASSSLEVTLFQDGAVVVEVARRDVGEGADGEGISAGDAGAAPGLRRNVAEERDRRAAHALEVLDEGGPGDVVGAGLGRRDVLIEARQRGVEAAREPERAGHEEPLAIAHVVDDLANRPLARLVGVQRLLTRDRREKALRRRELLLEDPDDVVAPDPVDVPVVVRRGLLGTGAASLLWHHPLRRHSNARKSSPVLGGLRGGGRGARQATKES